MKKSELFATAIADAKAMRAIAYANAKQTLEEAFTPKLQSMLSAKLKEEAGFDDEENVEPTEVETKHIDVNIDENHDESSEEISGEESTDSTEIDDILRELEEESSEEVTTDVAPEVSADDAEAAPSSAETETDSYPEGDDTSSDEAPVSDDDIEIEITDDDASSDDMEVAPSDENSEQVADQSADEASGNDDEEINIDEILAEMEDEINVDGKSNDCDESSSEEMSELREENIKLTKTLNEIQKQLSDVNLVNSKLLHATKLFREHSLSEKQKEKVVEAFDSTDSLKEVKLTYKVLSESLKKQKPTIKSTKSTITEGFASKSVSSTRPSSVNDDETIVATRLQTLAGIKIN